MSDEAVHLEFADGVATVTLDKPEVRNALTQDVSAGIIEAFDEIEDSDARCVVVEGDGGAFCAGGDVNAMLELMTGDVPLHEAVEIIVETTSRAIQRVAGCRLPTVAKIDGPAFGAGGNLAIATDVQLASEGAQISFGFRQVGLAVDSGTSHLLPRLVGENVAKELVFTGERVEADRAAELGLFNHVYPADEFDERADEFVRRVADGPTVALATSKRLLDQGPDVSLDQAAKNEATAQSAVFETRDHEEGVRAFMEKRRPEFEGR